MKRFVFNILFFFSLFCLFSEQKKPDYIINDRRIFEDARIAFENQEYGTALDLCNRAEAARKSTTDWEISTLENAFKPYEVKKKGDDINEVIPVLEEREDYDALEVIFRYKKYFGFESFNSSCKSLISFIQSRREFPEALFLKGKIFQIEGEYDLAETYLLQAYEYASILNVPDEKYDILYSLSDINYTKKDFAHYEEYLLLILKDDSAFMDSSLVSSMINTISSAKTDCLEKFFKMYRSENYKFLKAYFSLSSYYVEKNEKNRALSCAALGSLTGFTKIYNVISERNPDFVYKDFSSLLNEASSYDDLIDWGKNNGVWRGFNDFAEQAFRSSYSVFAMKLYEALQDSSPEEYWKLDASRKLKIVTGLEKP